MKTFTPGIEYRTNPRGRVSWGIGLEQLKLKRQQSGTWINAQTASQQRIAWTDRYVSGKINAVTATAYINILTQRMIQPFVGIGGGAGLGKIEYENHTAVDPAFLNDPVMGNLLRSLQGQVTTNRQKTYDAVLKGVVGASFFPNPHLVISGSPGYKNGAAGLFQFGVVF